MIVSHCDRSNEEVVQITRERIFCFPTGLKKENWVLKSLKSVGRLSPEQIFEQEAVVSPKT